MLRIVAYDISKPRTLNRIAKICLDFGVRLEKSVFVCDLTDEEFAELWRKLCEKADDETDRIVAYPICASCERRRREFGDFSHDATANVVVV